MYSLILDVEDFILVLRESLKILFSFQAFINILVWLVCCLSEEYTHAH